MKGSTINPKRTRNEKGKNPADKSAKCEMVDLNSNLSVITVKVNKIKASVKNVFVRLKNLKKACQTSILKTSIICCLQDTS